MEACNYIEFLQEKRADELLYQRWLHYQQCSFEEFKNKLKPLKVEKDEIILDKVQSILKTINFERRA